MSPWKTTARNGLPVLLIVLIASLPATEAWAQRGRVTLEQASLPEYCRDIDGGALAMDRKAALAKWQPIMGPTVVHMHHYCRGLVAALRAPRPSLSPRQQQHEWRKAVAEFTYVINRASPGFVLLPEAYYRRGMAYAAQDKRLEAIDDYRISMRLKSDYFPAYRALAELYRDVQRPDLAREVLAQGLRHAPGQPSLLALQRELGPGRSGAAAAQAPAARRDGGGEGLPRDAAGSPAGSADTAVESGAGG